MRTGNYKTIMISGSSTNIGAFLEAAIDKINQQLGSIAFAQQSQSAVGVANYGIVPISIIYKIGR